MASSFTTNKSIEKPAYNDYSGNPTGWSGPVNTDWDIIDAAFGGLTSLTDVTGTFTLSASQYQKLVLQSAATLTGNVRYNVPSGVGGQWIVRNATSGNFTLTIGTTAGGGTSVAIPQGQIEVVYSDGTNIRSTRSTADRFPVGGIVMWSGTIATIPTGWFLCNGSNGTPDLRDKFVIGATQDDAGVAKTNITGSLTQTGGDKNAVLVSHTHTATVTDPGHGHEFRVSLTTQSSVGSTTTGGFVLNSSTTSTQAANTGAASDSNQIGEALTGVTVANSTEGVSGTNANLPPYYALAYIMRGPY
jgi:hypothetical protein